MEAKPIEVSLKSSNVEVRCQQSGIICRSSDQKATITKKRVQTKAKWRKIKGTDLGNGRWHGLW